jgi:hypothetical protein
MLLWFIDAERDTRATLRAARSLDFSSLDSANSTLFAHQRRETLFILGSGQSVNELSEGQLEKIGKTASIGINYWFLHSLVPSVYAFESTPIQYGVLNDEQLRARERLAVRAGAQFADKSGPKVLHLRPFDGQHGSLFPLPSEVWSRTFLYGRANLIARSPHSLRRDLKRLVLLAGKALLPEPALPDNGASVVRLIFLGIAQGFRDIVLVGVDLDARPHFYFSSEYSAFHTDLMTLSSRPSGEPHETREAIHRPFDTLLFLSTLGDVLNTGKQAKLWVASESSTLSSSLPIYPWDTREDSTG